MFCRRAQLYSVKANWLPVSRHWDFLQISEEQESWRAGRRKIVQTPRRSDQGQECRPLSCSAALEAFELNCETSSFLDFPLNIYSASLAFCKIFLTKGRRHCRGGSLNYALYIERAVKNQTTNRGYRLVWEPMFSDELWYDLRLCSFSEFWRICFDRGTARLFVCFCNSFFVFVFSYFCCFVFVLFAKRDFSNLVPSIFDRLVWF